MRALTAAQAAIRAEMLRTRLRAKQLGRHFAARAVAVVFLLAAFVLVHIGAYQALLVKLGPVWGPLALGGGDVLLALILLISTGRRAQDDVRVREAADLRDRALREALRPLSAAALMLRVVRPLRRAHNDAVRDRAGS